MFVRCLCVYVYVCACGVCSVYPVKCSCGVCTQLNAGMYVCAMFVCVCVPHTHTMCVRMWYVYHAHTGMCVRVECGVCAQLNAGSAGCSTYSTYARGIPTRTLHTRL